MDNEEQAILDQFNEVFVLKVNKHIKDKVHILKDIFEIFEEFLTKPNKEYMILSHKNMEIVDKLLPTLDKKQKKMFEQHIEYMNMKCALENKQLFYFGYILTTIIDKERKMSSD